MNYLSYLCDLSEISCSLNGTKHTTYWKAWPKLHEKGSYNVFWIFVKMDVWWELSVSFGGKAKLKEEMKLNSCDTSESYGHPHQCQLQLITFRSFIHSISMFVFSFSFVNSIALFVYSLIFLQLIVVKTQISLIYRLIWVTPKICVYQPSGNTGIDKLTALCWQPCIG